MNPIRNILVIVDPTASVHPAIDKAALLTQRFSARMELFVCDTKASWNIRHARHASDRSRGEPVNDLKAMIEGLAEPLRQRGIELRRVAGALNRRLGQSAGRYDVGVGAALGESSANQTDTAMPDRSDKPIASRYRLRT